MANKKKDGSASVDLGALFKAPPKVVIAMPCSDSVAMKAKTAYSVANTIIESKGIVIDFILEISCDIVANRTRLVKQAVKEGATHILFVDSDMLFPRDALTRMLAHDKDIVAVEYFKRQLPLVLAIDPQAPRSETELYEANLAGTGLMLINLSIFEKMTSDPWFNFGRNSEGDTTLGEDVWFCNVARDAGFHVWIDPTITVKHLGEYAY